MKDANLDLNLKTLATYSKLKKSTICDLIIERKWEVTVHTKIRLVGFLATQQLTNRLETLGQRYSSTLDELQEESQRLQSRVNESLAKMGFWK